jgi:hypothetical protein
VQVAAADFDLLDRFEVVADQDAEPVDWDEAILDFLETVVERRHSARSTAKQEAR